MSWDALGWWLSRPANSFGAGVALAIVSLVFVIFGLALVVSGYRKAGRPDLPLWHPRHWIAPSLDFYVGLLFIELDGILYAYLSGLMLFTHIPVPRWFAVMAINGGIVSLLAFRHFIIDRRPLGQ